MLKHLSVSVALSLRDEFRDPDNRTSAPQKTMAFADFACTRSADLQPRQIA